MRRQGKRCQRRREHLHFRGIAMPQGARVLFLIRTIILTKHLGYLHKNFTRETQFLQDSLGNLWYPIGTGKQELRHRAAGAFRLFRHPGDVQYITDLRSGNRPAGGRPTAPRDACLYYPVRQRRRAGILRPRAGGGAISSRWRPAPCASGSAYSHRFRGTSDSSAFDSQSRVFPPAPQWSGRSISSHGKCG